MRIVGLAVAVVLLAACGEPGDGPAAAGDGSEPELSQAGESESLDPGWWQLPESPLSPRHEATAAWVDGSLLVFGGRDTDPCPPNADCPLPEEPPLQDGARFDPVSRSWTGIESLPVGVGFASTAVLGETVYVWASGTAGASDEPVFLAYDAGEDRWDELPLPPDAAEQWFHLEAGDGEVLFAQGSHENGWRPDLRYDPDERAFTELPEDPLAPSFDRDLTHVGERLVLTGIDVTESPGGADGPARYRAATWTEEDGWAELPEGDVVGWDPSWLAVESRIVNPTPGGTDGGETNSYDRVHPYGGILDPETGEWSELPDAPDAEPDEEALHVQGSVGDEELLVSAAGWALLPGSEQWVWPGRPDGGPESGEAVTVGDGGLYVFGGTRWSGSADAQSAELLETAWVYVPDRSE